MKLWQRYLLREFFKVFALFLFGFYFLYIAIDYCSHMQDFTQGKQIAFGKITSYYLFQFIKRADILLPLACMIAMMKVLLGWNARRELVAFQAGGLSWKQLIRPLLIVSLAISLLNLVIAEFALPTALRRIDHFYDANLRHSHRGNRSEPIHVLQLEDQSKLIYQYYDSSLHRFVDVIWMRSPGDLWRMKSLHADPLSPVGYFVDHLEKQPDGHIEKTHSADQLLFKELKWDKEMTRRGFIPYENRSISELYRLHNQEMTKYSKHELTTQMLFKLCMPLLTPLIALGIAPICVRYARQIPFFFLYAVSLFAYVAFVALMDAAVILGETATFSPLIVILLPFALPLTFFGWRYLR